VSYPNTVGVIQSFKNLLYIFTELLLRYFFVLKHTPNVIMVNILHDNVEVLCVLKNMINLDNVYVVKLLHVIHFLKILQINIWS